MKCPKCGYNSFEYNNICKKCSADISAYKQTYNIAPIVLPSEARGKETDEFHDTLTANEPPFEGGEKHDDMFSFDLPEDVVPSFIASQSDEPVKNSGFDDLLESTSQADVNPFGSSSFAKPSKPTAQTSGPGEFDFENFSWDDSAVDASAGGRQTPADDFDSLFGDTDESAKK